MVGVFRIVDKYVVGLLILVFFRLKYLFLWKKRKIAASPKRILVIRLWALWSSLLTFPMIKQLEDHYGDGVQYDLLATSRNIGVFKNQWYFHQIYNLFSLKGFFRMLFSFKKYDIVIDAEEYFRISSLVCLWTGKISVGYGNIPMRRFAYAFHHSYLEKTHNLMNCLSLLKSLGIHIHTPEAMEPLIYEQKHMIKVDAFLKQFNGKHIICLHTWWAETAPDRFRSPANRVMLIKKLIQKHGNGIVIFLSGTAFERQGVQEILSMLSSDEKRNVISLCGKFNLFEFAYLLTKCKLMISNDTGPMHLAAAMGTKTIGLFGPNLPERFGPWPLDKNIGLYKGNGDIYTIPEYGLFKDDLQRSIDRISPDDVLSVIHIL